MYQRLRKTQSFQCFKQHNKLEAEIMWKGAKINEASEITSKKAVRTLHKKYWNKANVNVINVDKFPELNPFW